MTVDEKIKLDDLERRVVELERARSDLERRLKMDLDALQVRLREQQDVLSNK